MGRKGFLLIGFLLSMLLVWIFHCEAVTDVSSTQTIPIKEKPHNLGHRGKAHSNAPSPELVLCPQLKFLPMSAPTIPVVQKTLPSAPASAPSRHISLEHKHSRFISPSIEFLSSHSPTDEVTDVSPTQTIPSVHPPIAESSHNLGHHGKALSNVPSPALVLRPQLKFPPMSAPTNSFFQKTLPSAPTSAPSPRIRVQHMHSRLISSSIEFLSPHTPIGEVTDISPTQTIPSAHPPTTENSHYLGHRGNAHSNAPSPARTNPFVQKTLPFVPGASSRRIRVEHQHLRLISPSLEFLSPHIPFGEVTDVSPAQTIPFAHPPIAESSHNLGHRGKAHSNAPSSVALHPQLKFPPMSGPTNPFVQKSLPSAPASAPSRRISVENNHSSPISPFIEFLSPQTPIGEVTDVSPTQTIPFAHPPIAESSHNLGHHGKALSNAPSLAPTNPFVQNTAPFAPTFAPYSRISVEHKHLRRISPSLEFLSPHTPSGEVTDISPTQTIPSAHPPTTENSHNLGHCGKAHNNAPSRVTDVSPAQTIPFAHPPIAESSHNLGHCGKAHSNAPSSVALHPQLKFPLMSAPTNPFVQKSLPSAPASAPSHRISVENNHLRPISPFIKFLSPQTPIGKVTDVSPTQTIPSAHPPIAESFHNLGHHGKALSNAPSPAPTNPFVQKTAPFVPTFAPSRRISVEHKHSRRISPSIEFLSPHTPSGEVTDISPTQTIPSAHPPTTENSHNLGHRGKAHSNAPSPVTDVSPTQTISFVHPPIAESSHNVGHHGKALSHAPSPAPANPVVQKPLPFAAASAPSRCISVEHKHLRLISPSIECLSPHTPTGEGTDVSPSQPIPSVLPPVGESVHNSRYHGKAHNDAPTPRIGISPSQPITHVLPPIEESLHNPRSHGKTHNNAPTPGTDLSPLLPIPSVLTPIGESFHNPGYHGTHNNAPILGHIVIPSNMNSSIPPHIAKLIPAGGYLGKSPISDAPKAMLVSKDFPLSMKHRQLRLVLPSLAFHSPQMQAGEGLVSFPSNLSPSMPPHIAKRIPGGGHHRNATFGNAPKAIPVSKEPVSSPPSVSPLKPPSRQSIVNAIAPSMTSCFSHGINKKGPVASPIWISPSITHWKRHGIHVAAPPREIITHSSPANHPPAKALSPVITPTHEQVRRASNVASPQPNVFPKIHERKRVGPPVAAPSNFFQRPHVRKRVRSPASAPSHLSPPYRASLTSPAPAHNLELGRASRVPTASPRRHWKLGPSSPTESPFPFTVNQLAPASFPSIVFPSSPVQGSIYPPKVSPSVSLPTMPSVPVSSPVRALPPPPPNQDCMAVTCPDPLTNTPPGSPCGCVLPLQVGLRLSVALYTFFPLVSELAQEMAAGIFMKQSQVRIMGANAASQQPEKTIVLIDLVPLGEKFDNTTAFLTYEKFWHKQVIIDNAFFGDYEVLYVRYPGLPPSPPSAPMNITLNDGPFIPDSNSRKMDPLGVDVRKQKNRLGGSLIAVIILSSAVVLLIFVGSAWFLLTRHEAQPHGPEPVPLNFASPFAKPSGVGSMISGSGPSSTSLSFASSIAMYMGSARTFSSAEIEKATDGFDPAKILGEGGFGRVYRGVLEDSMKVAVKVLKRDDQQGGREFLAEIEMLSRLHHRNLVKLIGICTEEHSRCLVYELIPNGSLESHLHGVDKERSPLDWGARVKIALGSARGLAYLHEDSSPRVIHRDFKSSNILLEDDFTPKVSDFGLARTALEEGNQHILTRVMGTFGYVAPEYAMTGHLLVKSDVYSYGVVLLELLTGRKPVDMSQPHGQENLVTWARPLLTSKEGLKIIIDPALADDFSFDSVAKVAAIASMCAQSDVSHRPFMGEVVQALKLVCDDTDEKNGGSDSCSKEELSAQDIEVKISSGSGQFPRTHSSRATDYDSGLEAERALSTSDLFSISARFVRQVSGSFRRHSSLGPLRSGRSHQRFWQRVKGLPRGSVSEHGLPSNCGQV